MQQHLLLSVPHTSIDIAHPSSRGSSQPPEERITARVKIEKPSTPLPGLPVGPGYVFTSTDKQLFAHAMVQFCAQDLHNFDIVEGEGFKSLIETVLFIGRRSHGEAATAISSFDSVRNLIPTAGQLKQVFCAQESYVRKATLSDLEAAKSSVLSLSCKSMSFGGEKYIGTWINYVTEDWQLTRRALR